MKVIEKIKKVEGLEVLALFSFECAGVAKDAKVKCPKCGAIFTIDEGVAEVQKKGY